MKKTIVLLLLIVAGTGCAGTQKYTNAVSSWVGHDVNELVQSWGYPQQTLTAPNGNTVYVYSSVDYGQNGVYTTPELGVGTWAMGGQRTEWYCNTFFEVGANKKVVNWRWDGNNCK